MLRPTQSLRFRPAPALQKLFSPPPPLPLDPQESKQLLNILTTSFREQLAKEHSEPSFRLVPYKPRQPASTSRPRRHSEISSRRIDRHLESLLANPLFTRPRENNMRSPMATFDMAVASGQMKIGYAKGCLVAQKRLITESPELSVRDAMKASGAGLKVVKWLQASGAVNNKEFLSDKTFRLILLEFMVAEDLQEVAWGWLLLRLESFEKTCSDRQLGWYHDCCLFSDLLSALIRAEIALSETLDNAFTCVFHAATFLTNRNLPEVRMLMNNSCRHLFRAIYKSDAPKAVSPSLYNAFIELVINRLKHRANVKARLMLHHPSEPSASLALQYFRSGKNLIVHGVNPAVLTTDNIMLGIETAHLLLEQNQLQDASWLIERLQRDYPTEFRQPGQTVKEEEELFNIQMLESLDLA